MFLPGFWCAVTTNPSGEIILAASEDNRVKVRNMTTGDEWSEAVPTDFLRYLDVAATETDAAVIGVGQGDEAFIVVKGQAVLYTRVHGQDSVGIVAQPDGTFVPYAVVSGLEWMRGSDRQPLPERLRGTSQGFRQVWPSVVFGDDAFGGVFGGHPIWRPVTHSGWTVGQRQDGVGCHEHATGRYFSALRGVRVAEKVDFAVTPDGTLAVCAATEQGAFYATFSPPYPPHEVPEQEPPMPLPDPSAVKAALTIERAKFPDRVDNDQCGAILNAVALQFPSVGMHRKTSGEFARLSNGETVNRNVLRYLPPADDKGWWADVLQAAGAGVAEPVAPDWQRSDDTAESFVPPVGTRPDQPAGDLESRVRALEQWRAGIKGIS